MKTYTAKELQEVLKKHKAWKLNEQGGQRADLQGADLQGANLRGADLQRADLQGADLQRANLRWADLQRADLQGADLRWADLQGANLRRADLQGADLRGADLQGADLRGADLRGANLQRADLQGAKEIPRSLIDYFKKDLRYVLLHCPKKDIEELKKRVIEGKINGTQYSGECACLIGTLYQSEGLSNENEFVKSHIPYYTCGLHNPSEQLFLQIRKGDTPETNQFSQIALDVIDEVLKGE